MGGHAGKVAVDQILHRMDDDIIHATEGCAVRAARCLP
jgi:hypothetical protein